MSLALDVHLVTCPRCGGSGEVGDYYWSDDEGCVVDDIRECEACNGTGEIRQPQDTNEEA